MKYNTPKEFWQLIKAFKAFKKQQQELAQLDQVVFDRFKAHLNEKQIQSTIIRIIRITLIMYYDPATTQI